VEVTVKVHRDSERDRGSQVRYTEVGPMPQDLPT
jgi:hypothetical protein